MWESFLEGQANMTWTNGVIDNVAVLDLPLMPSWNGAFTLWHGTIRHTGDADKKVRRDSLTGRRKETSPE